MRTSEQLTRHPCGYRRNDSGMFPTSESTTAGNARNIYFLYTRERTYRVSLNTPFTDGLLADRKTSRQAGGRQQVTTLLCRNIPPPALPAPTMKEKTHQPRIVENSQHNNTHCQEQTDDDVIFGAKLASIQTSTCFTHNRPALRTSARHSTQRIVSPPQ